MERKEALRVDMIIRQEIEKMGLTSSFDQHRVCYLWVEVVGPIINRYTARRWVENGIMHVVLTSASVKNELMFQRQALVNSLNQAVGNEVIRDIMFH